MEKDKIEILNVGPVNEAKLDLNKINVFMGEQSSGKSTIAKIISFCKWVEKDVALHQSFEEYLSNKNFFIEKLESFHNLKGYFNEKSEIKFESNSIKIHYKWEKFEISWVNQFSYKRNKISYIPSERSISILPGIEKVELPNNYLKSFLFDWFNAKKNYSKEKNLSLIDMGVSYYFSESNKENHISNNKNSYDILLSNASSGLSSITPLIVMIDYLINNIYNDEQNMSFEMDEVKANVTQILVTELVIKPIYKKNITDPEKRKEAIAELNAKISEKDENVLKYFNEFVKVRDGLFRTNRTNLIIEEPEQNLFPSTQKSLIYFLLASVNSNFNHQLTLTTHSPYVLYAINNCIMASLVSDKLSEIEKEKLLCYNSKVLPESITIYQIKDGYIKSIQKDDGLIGENFFDNQMRDVMDEFYSMLNHY
ncbi:MAG: AAA family ATPase [Bacteroidota bacterium]